ncbi:hypothetical protein J7E62_09535 [Variovorax paradoxus]|nr:hypothetical protein [Variovorax paradoxus]
MKKHLLMLAIASTCFVATQAGAMTQDEHKVAKEKIEADYKTDKAKCDAMKDNAKDVCQKEAKGKENVAKAELEQQYKPSDSNSRKVAEEKVKATYDVAKEKCDDLKGDAKNACEKEAKAEEAKGKADIKAMTAKK